ncbi:hypothetical protein RHGRI_012408 [Rhododendron griersonianum]|uniref:Uncharacterized protein n=1 Tax=Rhododendron griersonianum TaxID=479676 RepID=A0AAV6KRD2_9ERIC|nr:hypothetical protein RHGRI_012408 [Rhododendron griersonianum]
MDKMLPHHQIILPTRVDIYLYMYVFYLTYFTNQFNISSCASSALFTATSSSSLYLTVHPCSTPGNIFTKLSTCEVWHLRPPQTSSRVPVETLCQSLLPVLK